ncbi:T3SS effector OspC family protein, partial [Escherichia coli]|nr:T3SS effector OspC family protein [Escherichia coli]
DYRDVEYVLSDSGASPRILEFFILNELVDVNKRFTKCNAGNTMLDNANKFKNSSPKNQELFDLLLKHGALSGQK